MAALICVIQTDLIQIECVKYVVCGEVVPCLCHITQPNILHKAQKCVQKTEGILHLKCDGTPTETGFHLAAKRTSPFKSVRASVRSTTGSRGVRISGSNAGHTMFWGSVKGTGSPLHLPVSPSLPLLCVTMCHHVSTVLYFTPKQRI